MIHIPTWVYVLLICLALSAVAASFMFNAAGHDPLEEEDVPPAPEHPYIPPAIKHRALKDRLAMKQHALHGREVHELDQRGPRG